MDKLSQPPRGAFPLWVCYPLALILIILPVSDVLIGLFPMQLGSMQWRVGAVGLVSGVMLHPIVGVFLALMAAHWAGHFLTHRILAILCIVAGLIFATVLVLFVLDLVQIRGEIPEPNRRAFDFATVKGSLMLLAEAVIFLIFGTASIRTDRAARRSDRASGSRKPAVVARPSEPIAP